MVVKQGEELSYVEDQGTSVSSFCPSWSYNVCKYNTSISGRLGFKISKLAQVNKVVGHYNELKSLSNYFFDKFSKSIEKYYWTERFRAIVWQLAQFGDDNCCGHLEVIGLIAERDICISYVDDFGKTHIVFDDEFPVSPCQFVRAWGRSVSTFFDSWFEFEFRERVPGMVRFVS